MSSADMPVRMGSSSSGRLASAFWIVLFINRRAASRKADGATESSMDEEISFMSRCDSHLHPPSDEPRQDVRLTNLLTPHPGPLPVEGRGRSAEQLMVPCASKIGGRYFP